MWLLIRKSPKDCTMAATNSFTFTLDPTQQKALIRELSNEKYESATVPHTQIAVKGPNFGVNLYKSGKCLIQGKGGAEWVEFTLEPLILLKASRGYEEELNPKLSSPHLGVDESGKGDFFGPLVTASAYINPEIAIEYKKIGVIDSKRITSDKKAIQMARDIKSASGGLYSIVTLGPEAYNRLYGQFANLNKLLAWGHARVIENLLEKVPDCPRGVADQFGPKSRTESALMERGQKIVLEQRPRAESDPAVAAASILARAEFLQQLDKLGDPYGKKLLKGASAQVKSLAVEIVKQHGTDALPQIAKCHFKTAGEVLKLAGH